MDLVKAMCAEMNLTYKDMLDCSWKEFDYYQRGYNRRVERGWDYTRHLMANMYNSSGFSKKKVNPTDIMRLDILDVSIKPFKKVNPDNVKRLLNLMN